MKAMILAAGRGERMKELTQDTPKPLIKIAGRFLIEYAIQNLKNAGFHEIVINVSYQKEKIKNTLKDGRDYGVHIAYSEEEERLETGGGIVNALPLLGNKPFLVMSADIITDYPLTKLKLAQNTLAHLIVVDNPSFHAQGDFGLENGYVDHKAKHRYTFANIGIYHPDLFRSCQPCFFPLRDVLFPAIEQQQVTGEFYQGIWHNIGTPEDVALIEKAEINS